MNGYNEETANELCSDPDCMRINLKMSENRQPTGFIIGSNDSGASGCLGTIDRHLDAIPHPLKPIFQKILNDTKTSKANLERS